MKKILSCFLMVFFVIYYLHAQDRTFTGKITSKSDGLPVPGALITVKGSTIGTSTGADGSFSLKLPRNATTLVIRAIGLKSQEITIGNNLSANVVLEDDLLNLDEVVVTGLASGIKRSNLANAVATISSKELTGRTTNQTLDGAMSGKVAGANIVANSGAPGGGFSVKLRGIATINGASEPLYIVDGVFINNSQFQTGAGTNAFSGATGAQSGTQDQAANRLSDINPADIENIEILKGPSAAAIYGTRANAGVVIITTKKGQTGKTSITFGQDVGFAQPNNLLGLHKTIWDQQFISGTAISTGDDLRALYVANGSGARLFDYEKELYGNTGFLANTRISISGGTDKVRFYANGSLSDETGTLKNTDYQRNSIRLNLDLKPYSFLDFSINSNYVNSKSNRGFFGNDNNGVSIGYNMAYLPNWLDQFPVNGVYPENPITGQNPLEIVDKMSNTDKTNRFIQSFNANLYLFRQNNHSIKLSTQGGVDYLLSEARLYAPDDVQYQQRRANPGASRFTNNRNINTNLQAFLVYNGSVKDFTLTTQVGAIRLTTDQKLEYIQGEGLKAKQDNPNTALVRTPNSFFAKWQDVGVVAQQEINWKDRFIATGGIRFDKSSLNGDNGKYYAFPKASVAINISKFDFWKIESINQFKIRAAYGETGGLPKFGDIFTSLGDVVYGNSGGSTAPTVVGNPVIEPETAREYEFGADFSFFDNRLSLEATYYDKKVFNLINAYNLSSGTGVAQIVAFPIGDLQNKGIELGLSGVPVQKKNFTWTTNLNWWRNRSEITKLTVPEFALANTGFGAFGTNRVRLGSSPSAWFGTPNVNGRPTQYEDAQPKWQMTFSNNLTIFKNFEFGFLLAHSHKPYNSSLNQELTDEGGTSPDWSTLNAEGTPLGVARQLGQPGVNTRNFIVDATFTKLREVSLYYTVPNTALPKKLSSSIQSIKIGVSGNNVFTITDYYGYDPEVSNFGNRPVGGSVDLLSYPQARRLFFHFNVNF